jgi:hypothetical protein
LLLLLLLLQIAPKIMSWSQLAAAAKSAVVRQMRVYTGDVSPTPAYAPKFADSTIDHFLLHPGTQ